MNNYYITFILCLVFLGIQAQDLATKIPKTANIVATIKGKNITDLLSIHELDNTKPGKKLLKEISRKSKLQTSSISELGIDFTASAYYFYQVTDSITYHCSLIPLKDVKKFEAHFTNPQKVKKIGNLHAWYKFEKPVFLWDDSMVLYIEGKLTNKYFDQQAVKERNGLLTKPKEEYHYKDRVYYPFKNYDHKKEIEYAFILNKAKTIFSNNSLEKSIVANKEYQKNYIKKAEVSVWVSDYQNLYQSHILKDAPRSHYDILLKQLSFSVYDRQSFAANLYLEDSEIKITATTHMGDEMGKSFKKMSNRKINSRFFKYINEQEMTAYLSYAINTQAVLKEYPKIINRPLLGSYLQEMSFFIELISLVLDEEAIDKVIKGDILLVLYDTLEKQVDHTSYEYDDNFNRIETVKKRSEQVPDFQFLFSSEDTKLLHKLLDLGKKKEYVTYKNGAYIIKNKKLPFDIYVTIKNGVIAVGSSLERVLPTTVSISNTHKKILKNNNLSVFVDSKKMINLMSSIENNEQRKKKYQYLYDNVENLILTSSKIRNNAVTLELKTTVPKADKNGLQYLFRFLEEMTKY
ncbi:hypothetical protein HN014_06530 [Aquimarina sp. TRL1]|uniref:hypothetical protein n=1 Tax=Aquimarina sp. (strain TRL1) TaxID=2736252 RepID=UPI00158CEC9C|nr:hypothetical protein [Aquimarina sp. TRL1]QKX04582.1 hypothetical protein HN014_06530 [Aquimarina sp. TRL1]